MRSLKQFEHKSHVLATIGFILATPLGTLILNWFLTNFQTDSRLKLNLAVGIILAYAGYIFVSRSLGLMKEIDAENNRLFLRT